MRHWYSRALSIMVLITITGCGPRIKQSSLIKLSNKNAEYVSTKNNVTIRAKKLPKPAIKNLFGVTGTKIAAHPIEVVHLCIGNYLDYPVCLTSDQVGVKLLADTYIKSLCYEDLTRYLVKDFFTGIGIAAALAVCSCGPLLVGVVPAGVYCAIAGGSLAGGIAISSPVVSYKTRKAKVEAVNSAIDSAIHKAMLIDSTMVLSGTVQDCLLFIAKKNYKSKFAITLTDQHNKEIQTFNIKLS